MASRHWILSSLLELEVNTKTSRSSRNQLFSSITHQRRNSKLFGPSTEPWVHNWKTFLRIIFAVFVNTAINLENLRGQLLLMPRFLNSPLLDVKGSTHVQKQRQDVLMKKSIHLALHLQQCICSAQSLLVTELSRRAAVCGLKKVLWRSNTLPSTGGRLIRRYAVGVIGPSPSFLIGTVSADLAPTDFYLFSKLKSDLHGRW